MPDENGTEATRSDAPSADESLFGDAADDTAAAVDQGEDSKGEIEQDGQGSDDAGEQAGAPEDLKVVVSLKEAGPPSACNSPRRTRTSRRSTARN